MFDNNLNIKIASGKFLSRGDYAGALILDIIVIFLRAANY